MHATTLCNFGAALLSALASEPPPVHKTGPLTFDGIPETPRGVVERTQQYANTRGAVLLDFAPDGRGVLVATRFGDTSQLHHVAGPAMAREQLTFFPEPVTAGAYDKSRNTSGFVFRLDVGGNELYQFHWYDRGAGRSTLLTDGASRNESLILTNSGGQFACSSTARNKKDFDIYVGSLSGSGQPSRVKELKGLWSPLDWSPDDSLLLVRNFVSIHESYLHILNPRTGKLTQINPQKVGVKIAYGSAQFSRTGQAVYYTSDEGSEVLQFTRLDLATGRKDIITASVPFDVTDLAVSNDGSWLAWAVNENGASQVYAAPTRDPRRWHRLDLPTGVVNGLMFDDQSQRLGLSLSMAQASSDVYVMDLKDMKPVRWTFSEVGGLNAANFVAPELVEFPSFDRRKITAWYYRPAASENQGRLPVVVSIHGGPEAQARPSFEPMIQYWVRELGMAVVVPNVRGSAGFGKSFLQLDNGEKREDAVKVIGALLDWVGKQDALDKDRLAVFGGSYGGYMVLASMIHHGNRIRCGVDIVGISNFVTFLENTEAYRKDLRRVEYGDERQEKMRQFLQAIAPTAHAARIKQPLFVLQGANDPRVPVSEAEQIVRNVRQGGGTVWYLLADDEGHGFQKKRNREVLMQTVSQFLELHLSPQPPVTATPGRK
jgi:dipeptidyl aminopeptidase/acylaminoacyl peptidase